MLRDDDPSIRADDPILVSVPVCWCVSSNGSIIGWSVRFGIHVWLAGSRENGEALTYRILQHFVRQAEEEGEPE